MTPGAPAGPGGEATKRRHLLLSVLAGLIAVVALAVPALAVAAPPNLGWFSGHDDAGGSVTFRVYSGVHRTPSMDGTKYDPVEHDEFKPQSKFEVVQINGGAGFRDSFGTCAYEPVTEVFSREYCLYGQFDAPNHAFGTMRIYISAYGKHWPKPLATFRWSAEQEQSKERP
ncbi:MAG: hypothetical protein ACRDPE_21725 [Solirubrobacterales bacterium]